MPDPWSLFRGIAKLPPGHTLLWRNGEVRIESYWQLEVRPASDAPPYEECLDRADELLREAVGTRLISDVPLGAFLSGGVDSSLVVALMALQMSEPVKTFSIGFDEERFNELPYARMVAERYGTEHHEEIVRRMPRRFCRRSSRTSMSPSPTRRRSPPTTSRVWLVDTLRWLCPVTAATRSSPATTATSTAA